MNVTFESREQAKINIPNLEDTLIISISDTVEEMNEMRAYCGSGSNTLCALRFLDDEEDFGPWHAELIMAFLNKAFEERKDIYVHCFMGVSRSGAIAKFTNDYFGLDIDYINNYNLYNRHVYSGMLIASGMSINERSSMFNGDFNE